MFGMSLYLPIQVSLSTLCKEIYKTCPKATQKYPTYLSFPTSIPVTLKKMWRLCIFWTQSTLIYVVQNQEAYRANNLRLYANVMALIWPITCGEYNSIIYSAKNFVIKMWFHVAPCLMLYSHILTKRVWLLGLYKWKPETEC